MSDLIVLAPDLRAALGLQYPSYSEHFSLVGSHHAKPWLTARTRGPVFNLHVQPQVPSVVLDVEDIRSRRDAVPWRARGRKRQ